MARVYNFGAGPCTLPLEVLEEAQREFLDYRGIGMSIMECSHRGKAYQAVHDEAMNNLRQLLHLPQDYALMLLPGGASMQFAMVPLNLASADATADYTLTGSWAAKAAKEAAKICRVHAAADTSLAQPARMPEPEDIRSSGNAAYLHLTSNETIDGTQWKDFPNADIPVVADMSSDILSRPLDISRFDLIYAGAQKNLGPAGVALVAVRRELAERAPKSLPSMLRYQNHIDNDSMLNTPPSFPVYMLMLVTRWILKTGLENIWRQNRDKSRLLYQEIDRDNFYRGTAHPQYRSEMNVTFRLPSEALEKQFVTEAETHGLHALKGHRSVGGIRASIYNAFPLEGVKKLCLFMSEFRNRNAAESMPG